MTIKEFRDIIDGLIDERDREYKTYLLMVNELNRKTIDVELIGAISDKGDTICRLQDLIEDVMRRRIKKEEDGEQ